MRKFQMTTWSLLTIACMVFAWGALAQSLASPWLQKLSTELVVKYELISNVDVADCREIFDGPCFESRLHFSLPQSQELPAYTLYFSHIAPIKWDDHQSLNIRHINGDLHQITFTGNEFSQGTTLSVGFKAAFWHASQSDIMPNFFIVAQGLKPEGIRSTMPVSDSVTGLQLLPHTPAMTRPEQYRRGADDSLPLADAEWLFNHYERINSAGSQHTEESRIIPNFQQASWTASETVDLTKGVQINWGPFVENAVLLKLLAAKGVPATQSGLPLKLANDAELQQGQYHLSIERKQITVRASNREGLQYALVSLFHLINKENLTLPVGEVADKPRYDFRGVHMDLARNFLGKETVLKLVNQMFLLKLNKLHLHLADDEGWRLQLTRLPELTEIGGYRCFDPAEDTCLLPQLGSGPHKDNPVNGYLTESDYLEIIQYAHARHIEVIPSFDLPGHARAAVKAMEARYRKYKAREDMQAAEEFLLTDFDDTTEYSSVQFYKDNTVNPCMDSTYHFIDTVISDVKALHAKANVPLTTYHIGADETAGAWKLSPVCQSLIQQEETLNRVSDLKPYFLNRLLDIVAKHELKAAGWSDGMHKVISERANEGHQVNVWDTLFWGGHKIAEEFNQHGWDTVLSIPDVNYFDFPYQNSPQETGYYWASKNTDEFKVFQFMPDNLAANAVQWTDRKGQPFSASLEGESLPVKGIQAQIWTEAVRSPQTFDYLMFPRLQAFAERAWYQAPWELVQKPAFKWQYGAGLEALLAEQSADWQSFSRTLLTQAKALHAEEIAFRLPPPGAKLTKGKLQMNSAWSGLALEYQAGDGQWRLYTGPVVLSDSYSGAKNSVKVRTRLGDTSKTSRVLEISIN